MLLLWGQNQNDDDFLMPRRKFRSYSPKKGVLVRELGKGDEGGDWKQPFWGT